MLKKLTPVLPVERIEPVLRFWQRFGVRSTVEVLHGDAIGFVILAGDGIELMYQTLESLNADLGSLGVQRSGAAILYVEVSDISAIEKIVHGGEIAVPKRVTSYGATEIFVRDPAGYLIGFAQHSASE